MSFFDIFYCFVGVFLGTLVGVIPGIGAGSALALMFPFSFYMTPIQNILIFSGIYYGAQYGGSTTSILMKTAGEASSIPTIIDGHKMALLGKAGSALSISALGSFFAGCLMTIVLYFFAPLLANVTLFFGPVEYVSICVFALFFSIALADDEFLTSFGLACIGILIGTIGLDPMMGIPRFTFGNINLYDGIGILVLSLGFFAMVEVFKKSTNFSSQQKINSMYPSTKELKDSIMPIIRGTTIGGIIGLLPGGAMLSSFAAYFVEKKINSKVGSGVIQGVASPESANNAGVQSSFVPFFTLGLPTNSAMAIILSVMLIHGFPIGPQILKNNFDFFSFFIFSMLLGNFFLLLLNLPLVKIWLLFLHIPNYILKTIILFSACFSVYYSTYSFFDVGLLFFISLFAFILYKLSIESTIVFFMGYILGPMLEINFRRAMMMYKGDYLIFFNNYMFLVLVFFIFFVFYIKKIKCR